MKSSDTILSIIKNDALLQMKTFPFKWYFLSRLFISLVLFIFSGLLLLNSARAWYGIFTGTLLLYISVSIVGFGLMHEASHNLCKNKVIKKFSLFISICITDINAFRWSKKHVELHHQYNGILEKDEDIQDLVLFFKLYANQKTKWFHKYQHIYFIPLLGFVLFADKFCFSYRCVREFTNIAPFDFLYILLGKIVHYAIYLVIPSVIYSFPKVFTFYIIFIYATSMINYLILFIGHAEMPIFRVSEIKNQSRDYLQVLCTSSFSANSWWITFLTGGINLHTEHHLLPSAPVPILKKMHNDLKSQLPFLYNYYPTIFGAICAQVKFLKRMSNKNSNAR